METKVGLFQEERNGKSVFQITLPDEQMLMLRNMLSASVYQLMQTIKSLERSKDITRLPQAQKNLTNAEDMLRAMDKCLQSFVSADDWKHLTRLDKKP